MRKLSEPRKWEKREKGKDHLKCSRMCWAWSCRLCGTSGKFIPLELNGWREGSPVWYSAVNTGITGVPLVQFWINAHSYLDLNQWNLIGIILAIKILYQHIILVGWRTWSNSLQCLIITIIKHQLIESPMRTVLDINSTITFELCSHCKNPSSQFCPKFKHFLSQNVNNEFPTWFLVTASNS